MPGLQEFIEGLVLVVLLPGVAGIVLTPVWPYAWLVGGAGAIAGFIGLIQGYEEGRRKG